jgi:hypothetical protein
MSSLDTPGSPKHLGRIAVDRWENRTDNSFDRHDLSASYKEWDEAFVKRRKETSRPAVAVELLPAPLQLKWEDM